MTNAKPDIYHVVVLDINLIPIGHIGRQLSEFSFIPRHKGINLCFLSGDLEIIGYNDMFGGAVVSW